MGKTKKIDGVVLITVSLLMIVAIFVLILAFMKMIADPTETKIAKEVIRERATVIYKGEEPAKDQTGSAIAVGVLTGRISDGYNYFLMTSEPEKKFIAFKTDHDVVIQLDNEVLYGKFNLGDSATIEYRKIYQFNYRHIDWSFEKKFISQKLAGYEFLKVRKK